MKTYTVISRGTIPASFKMMVEKYEGLEANRDTCEMLSNDIDFIVVDLREAHGNMDGGFHVRGAWLCPKNNDNSWNVIIEVKKS